jgi:hypothetical protein
MQLRVQILDASVNWLDNPIVLEKLYLPSIQLELLPFAGSFKALEEISDEFSPTNFHRENISDFLEQLRAIANEVLPEGSAANKELETLTTLVTKYLKSERPIVFQFSPIEFLD